LEKNAKRPDNTSAESFSAYKFPFLWSTYRKLNPAKLNLSHPAGMIYRDAGYFWIKGGSDVSRMEVVTPKQNPIASEDASLKSGRQLVVSGSSLLFSILQSVCTAVVAINGVRLAVGLSSLAMTVGVGATLDHFHDITWLRLTLMIGALTGSILTLFIVYHARNLRSKPAARWRLRPLTLHQRKMEGIQIAISVLTLVLVVIEEYFHFKFCHTL
jgi:hypothetical protein